MPIWSRHAQWRSRRRLPEIAPDAPCTAIGDAAGQVWVTDHTKVWHCHTPVTFESK
jgi:hypothetical protein